MIYTRKYDNIAGNQVMFSKKLYKTNLVFAKWHMYLNTIEKVKIEKNIEKLYNH